ncbi:uncharacterized protein LOC126791862 [Argentina anserina]|uniref:uncharacterized protein LOC126791862 n=1 Tax=Argentina anserina TaxID=57926 RepID=UPI0021763BD8|nr:uncharacterized protein LOC126791862 [Potentilla anserina]
MEIIPTTYYENVKRYWRRRRYQRLYGDCSKKKMRVAKLGGGPNGSTSPTRSFKIRKLRLIRFVSPIKLLSKFHGGYVDMMVRMAGNVGGARRVAGGSKKVAKAEDQVVSVAALSGEEAVDTRLVLEIYKRLAASRQLASY